MLKSIEQLQLANVPYEVIKLPDTVHTAIDVKNVCGCDLDQVIKTMVLTGSSAVIALIPGNLRLSLDKIRLSLSDPSLKLANPLDVKRLTDTEPGSVSPIGDYHDLTILVDMNIQDKEKVFIGSGQSDTLISLKVVDLLEIAHGKVADISEKQG